MAFVVASHYRLQITFLLSQACLKGFSLVRDDRRFCKNCCQQGLIVYQTQMLHQHLFEILLFLRIKPCGTLSQKAINVRDLLAFVYV